jgi:hypothetical protein
MAAGCILTQKPGARMEHPDCDQGPARLVEARRARLLRITPTTMDCAERKTGRVKRYNAANRGNALFWNACFVAVPKWHRDC